MASSPEFVTYVCDQLAGAGEILCKKMFGEYSLYTGGKLFACICDDRLLVKITAPGEALLPGCPREYPYEGSRQLYFRIENLEDTALLCALVQATCDSLPLPKPKKKKGL